MPRVSKNPIVLLALSPAATATALGVQPRDVYAAVNRGELPVFRKGTKSRILVADVEHWIRTTWSQTTKQKTRSVLP